MDNLCKKEDVLRMLKRLARRHVIWELILNHPTPHEKAHTTEKEAIHVLNELFSVSSDLCGFNINPVKAYLYLTGNEGSIEKAKEVCDIDGSECSSRKITKEQFEELMERISLWP